ncbi:MAG: endonuclease/exonuclease/phosphatase family protein [Polyangiaceae bacterium]|nr:endonuclease/exonuclease/phosphatase family protein [Polyangiaceae bacterium]
MVDTLDVATLNVWNKAGPWAERLALVRSELAQRAVDVLGLQEVLRFGGAPPGAATCQAWEIAEGLGYHVAFGRAADYGGGLFFGNAVLSRHPLLEERVFELPGKDSGETRSLLYTRLDTPAGALPVFVTHLNWKLHHGAVRLDQVRAIVDTIFSVCPLDEQALPPVLMGDFNAEPDSDEIRFLRGFAVVDGRSVYFADAWVYGADGSPGYTFDRRNHYAALAHEPPRRIDYIFVRGPDRYFRGEPTHTELAFCTSAEGPDGEVWPSDHFGLRARLVVGKRER